MENTQDIHQLKTEKKGFIISMEEAAILKFNLDVLRKEIKKHLSKNSSISLCITQIRKVLNEAKQKRTIVLRES